MKGEQPMAGLAEHAQSPTEHLDKRIDGPVILRTSAGGRPMSFANRPRVATGFAAALVCALAAAAHAGAATAAITAAGTAEDREAEDHARGALHQSKRDGQLLRYPGSQDRVTLQRAMPGRLDGRACSTATKHNQRHRHCARWVNAGATFTRADTPGANHFPFTARQIARKLALGQYRLQATPHAHGLVGRPLTAKLRIKARSR